MKSDNLISRQAAIDAIQKLNIPEDMCVFEIISHIEVEIATLPSAQPERKTGRWIDDNCSECGQYVFHGDVRNFCPSCGAKMLKDGEG